MYHVEITLNTYSDKARVEHTPYGAGEVRLLLGGRAGKLLYREGMRVVVVVVVRWARGREKGVEGHQFRSQKVLCGSWKSRNINPRPTHFSMAVAEIGRCLGVAPTKSALAPPEQFAMRILQESSKIFHLSDKHLICLSRRGWKYLKLEELLWISLDFIRFRHTMNDNACCWYELVNFTWEGSIPPAYLSYRGFEYGSPCYSDGCWFVVDGATETHR